MLSIGHVTNAPDTRVLHDSRWLSVTVVYEVMTAARFYKAEALAQCLNHNPRTADILLSARISLGMCIPQFQL